MHLNYYEPYDTPVRCDVYGRMLTLVGRGYWGDERVEVTTDRLEAPIAWRNALVASENLLTIEPRPTAGESTM